MEQFTATVEKSGRILIPAAVRRRFGLEGESQVLLNVDEHGITITTRRQALARLQASIREQLPGDVDLAAELIADRRREAEREK